MPLDVPAGHPSLLIRRAAYERAGLARFALDERLGLTADEFRVEGDLIVIGPIFDEEALGGVLADLEGVGLAYFEDFFEMSGNWPDWLRVLAMAAAGEPGA
ncbi:MAG TPA: hypothetical protein VGE02_10405 [Gemmatimonadales bacterium]